MRLEEQYRQLIALKTEINQRLQNHDFEQIRDLMKYLDQDANYIKLKTKDTQLGMLDTFLAIWLKEKTKLTKLGIANDIFDGVSTLDELESKYLAIEFAVLRLETPMPIELYAEAVETLIGLQASGLALFKLIQLETADRKNNVMKLAEYLNRYEEYQTAASLLEEAVENGF